LKQATRKALPDFLISGAHAHNKRDGLCGLEAVKSGDGRNRDREFYPSRLIYNLIGSVVKI
jgi:hypothetical protein